MARRPVAIDLFAGAGGLSLGFEAAGFDVLAAVEYDAVHAATHLYNFPHCEMIVQDVSNVTAAQIVEAAAKGWRNHYADSEWDGVIDVIIGGPSCQGFSTMGKQDPNDDRNKLVLEFVRLVEELRPRAFCMENVPGFLDPRFNDIRTPALDRMRAAGYTVSGDDRVLKAEDFGVPQKRRRVVITGALGQAVAEPIATSESPYTVSDALAGLPHDLSDEALELRGDVARSWATESPINAYLQLIIGPDSAFSELTHPRSADHDHMSGFLPTQHAAETRARFEATLPGKKEPVSRSHRLDPKLPALTLRAGTGRERGAFSATRPIHPDEPRVITVREAARLHSYPDWFRFHATNWHAHRQVGNSVPPLLALAIGRSIRDTLGAPAQASIITEGAASDVSLLQLNPTAAAKWFSVPIDQIPTRTRSVVVPVPPEAPTTH